MFDTRRARVALIAFILGCTAIGAQEGDAPRTASAPRPAASGLGIDAGALIGTPDGTPLTGEDLKSETREVASKLRCPICQGLSVADSPTASAFAMMSQVRDLLAAGFSEDQILDYFEGAYGEFVRLQPRANGFNLVIWLGPPLLLISVMGLWFLGRRRRAASADDDEEGLSDYLDRVRSEIDATPKESG